MLERRDEPLAVFFPFELRTKDLLERVEFVVVPEVVGLPASVKRAFNDELYRGTLILQIVPALIHLTCEFVRQVFVTQGIRESDDTHLLRDIVFREPLEELLYGNLMFEGLVGTFDNEIVPSRYLSGACHYL